MRRWPGSILLALALCFGSGPALAQANRAAAARVQDWSRFVTVTPEGGFRMGNPAAPVKLVEFLSLTCGHCAAFARDTLPRLLNDHVRPGRVSIEYRNFVLNGVDLAAALLSRCAPPSRYFEVTGAMLADQERWLGRLSSLPAAQAQELQTSEPRQALPRIATLAGLDRIAAAHGVTARAAQACLGNPQRLQRLVDLHRAATQLGVTGTPSFLVNGRLVDGVHDWTSLEPHLRPPGR